MKKFLMIGLLILITSCGRKHVYIGAKGEAGSNGQDGYSLVVDMVAQTIGGVNCNRTDIFQDKDRNGIYSAGDTYQNGFLTCNGAIGAQGIQGVAGTNGQDGIDGQDGQNGLDGVDGLSSYQIALAHGFVGSETDYLTSLHGTNGTNGTNGAQGPQGLPGINANTTYQVVAVIDPCGPQHPQGFDEVILKLGNGQYLASFSDNANGQNTRFGILPNGSYITTDGTGCHFSLPIL